MGRDRCLCLRPAAGVSRYTLCQRSLGGRSGADALSARHRSACGNAVAGVEAVPGGATACAAQPAAGAAGAVAQGRLPEGARNVAVRALRRDGVAVAGYRA